MIEITERICPVCKKNFVYSNKTNWAWKTKKKTKERNRRTVVLCSYSCYRKVEKGEVNLQEEDKNE